MISITLHSSYDSTKVIFDIIIRTWFVVIKILIRIIILIIFQSEFFGVIDFLNIFLILDDISLILKTLTLSFVGFSYVSLEALAWRLILISEPISLSLIRRRSILSKTRAWLNCQGVFELVVFCWYRFNELNNLKFHFS